MATLPKRRGRCWWRPQSPGWRYLPAQEVRSTFAAISDVYHAVNAEPADRTADRHRRARARRSRRPRAKANVFIDLSGWSPKYFPPELVRAANSLLQDKVRFGTGFPLLTPERWLRDFDSLDIKPAVRPKILKENAVRVLRLDKLFHGQIFIAPPVRPRTSGPRGLISGARNSCFFMIWEPMGES
jgi:hypothetical protein